MHSENDPSFDPAGRDRGWLNQLNSNPSDPDRLPGHILERLWAHRRELIDPEAQRILNARWPQPTILVRAEHASAPEAEPIDESAASVVPEPVETKPEPAPARPSPTREERAKRKREQLLQKQLAELDARRARIRAKVRRTVEVLSREGDHINLRMLDYPKRSGRTVNFLLSDRNRLIEIATQESGRAKGIYLTLNMVTPGASKLRLNSGADERSEVADAHIAFRRWLPIDLDPVRNPKDQPSSWSEKASSLERLKQVHGYLRELGFGEMLIGDNGNGHSLLIRSEELQSDEASNELFHNCLLALSARFSDDGVQIDTSVSNAARIFRLFGTKNCKGEDRPEIGRPHRESELLFIPEVVKPEQRAQFEKLATLAPKPEKISGRKNPKFDADKWLSDHKTKLEELTHGLRGPIQYGENLKFVAKCWPRLRQEYYGAKLEAAD